jgi:sulfofructose kinase
LLTHLFCSDGHFQILFFHFSFYNLHMQFPFILPAGRKFDVVGFGTNAVDFLISVPEYPAYNSKIELTDYVRSPGGEVATTMAGLTRLGLRTSYIGSFGDDDAGEIGLRSLHDEGVDLTHARVVPGSRTQIAFIIIDVGNGERTVIWKRDPELAFTVSEAPLHVVSEARVFHFTPHDAEAASALAREARNSGTIVSADIDNVFEGSEDLFSLVDIFIVSADLSSKLFGKIDQKEGLRRMKERYGCEVVGATLGSAGSLILCGDTFFETPGFDVPGGCKDTTGAGDAFRVGLLYGLINGHSIEESARMANATAALKCRAVGARTALPTLVELQTALK